MTHTSGQWINIEQDAFAYILLFLGSYCASSSALTVSNAQLKLVPPSEQPATRIESLSIFSLADVEVWGVTLA